MVFSIFMPDCHLSVTPIPLRIFGNGPRPTAARLLSQLWSVPHPSFPGSRFLGGSALSASVNRILINGSQGVQSPGAAAPKCSCSSPCESVFTAARGLRWSPFHDSVQFLSDPFHPLAAAASKYTFRTSLSSLCPGLSHEVETGDVD